MTSTSTITSNHTAPQDVHAALSRHILADGFPFVFDYEKSHGSWVHDARTGREFLDFLTFFGSQPDRLQPPEDEGPGVPAGPARGWRS